MKEVEDTTTLNGKKIDPMAKSFIEWMESVGIDVTVVCKDEDKEVVEEELNHAELAQVERPDSNLEGVGIESEVPLQKRINYESNS